MSFDNYKTKPNVIVVYTGEGKGKTSASLGLMARSLGAGWNVAYIQFIKHWEVNEHKFINSIMPIYSDKLFFHKGGKGFYDAGQLSAKGVTEEEHKQSALDTYQIAMDKIISGQFQLIICDEINNAVNDGLLSANHLEDLISAAGKTVNLCLTGRNFPPNLLHKVDIATEMTKLKHHFDDKFLANNGIDF